jgi:Skp family chaperone for outer membrane proteins
MGFSDILFKIGVLDIDTLSEEYPEAKAFKTQIEEEANKKYYILQILEKKYQKLNEYKEKNTNLSDQLNIEVQLNYLFRKIEELKNMKKAELENLQQKKGKELKMKMYYAIKEARKKKGFGIILNSREKFIIFYNDSLNFTKFVLEELAPKEEKKR